MPNYVIDPLNGIDTQSGLEGHPWKTPYKATLTAIAGDRVKFRGGAYTLNDNGSLITTRNHGQENAPIIFERYGSENPIFKSQPRGIFLAHNYLVFDGLNVINDSQAAGMIRGCEAISGGAHHVTLKNMIFRNMRTGDPSWGIDWQFMSYGKILDCIVDHVGTSTLSGAESGNGIGIAGHHNLIENTKTDYCGHAGLFLTGAAGGYHVARGCEFIGTWGVPGEFLCQGVTNNHTLVENNIFRHTRSLQQGLWTIGTWQQQGSGTIFRRNRLYDGSGMGFNIYSNAGYHSKYNRFYHNIVYDMGWGNKETPPAYNRGPFSFKEEAAGTSLDNIFKNHIHFSNAMDASAYSGTANAGQHSEIGILWNATNPMFVDAPNGDFRLRSGSPAINAGEFLTRTASGGSGYTLSLQDAKYFCDGWGIVEGDYVQLEGRTGTAKIVSVDYANNRITIDKSWQWAVGQGVSLPFSGTGPDIGAFEYSASPDFAMSANPNLVIVTQGQSGTAQIGASAINGFSSRILLSVEGLPAYSVATISPSGIYPEQQATLTLGTSTNTPPGDHSVKVTGEG